MDSHSAVETDPKQLAQAEAFWQNFTVTVKFSIVAIALLLSGMAVVFFIL